MKSKISFITVPLLIIFLSLGAVTSYTVITLLKPPVPNTSTSVLNVDQQLVIVQRGHEANVRKFGIILSVNNDPTLTAVTLNDQTVQFTVEANTQVIGEYVIQLVSSTEQAVQLLVARSPVATN